MFVFAGGGVGVGVGLKGAAWVLRKTMQKNINYLNVKPRCCPERMGPPPLLLSYSDFSSSHSSLGITKPLNDSHVWHSKNVQI